MRFEPKFTETNQVFNPKFGEIQTASDGGYERGYAEAISRLRARIDQTLTFYEDSELQTIGDYSFYNCSKLTGVDFPNCTQIGNYAFQYCSALKEVVFPNVVRLGDTYSYAFSRCTNLEKADFGSIEFMGGYAFQLCSKMSVLIIRTQKVCELQGVSAINSTAINSKNGYIYVPDNLVEQYKVAPNWSTFATQIKPLSELPDE